jgi:probable rRNA maturation factor
MKERVRKRADAAAIVLLIEEPRWRADVSALRAIRRAVRLALPKAQPGQSVTILLTGDAKLRALNSAFRGKDATTNVLSFPAVETDPSSLGDIALAYGLVKREARAQRKDFAAHAAHLALHGTLHLLGYDHEKAKDARIMESLETGLLADLGISDPYRADTYTRGRKKA